MKLLVFIAVLMIASASGSTCVPPKRTTPEMCVNPPVVRKVDLSAYSGRWFNIFSSGTAQRFGFPCVTANYTVLPDGTVSVLNCNLPPGESRPKCLRGVATPINPTSTARLKVSVDSRRPSRSYNIAALLGRRSYGYFAAAVYSCIVFQNEVREGFFIIARAPFAPSFVLKKLKEKLRCKGYLLEDEFERTSHNRQCRYFDSSGGFDITVASAFPRLPGN